MTAVVKLKYGDAERSTRLVNDQLHIPTIKDMFGLSSVDVDGVAEPADDRGFTFATYLSGSTLHISGSPAQAAVLSGMVHTAFYKNSRSLCWHLTQHSKWQWPEDTYQGELTSNSSMSHSINTCGSAGHSDLKAVVDQEIAQEIARLEAKIDAVIGQYCA